MSQAQGDIVLIEVLSKIGKGLRRARSTFLWRNP